MQYLKHFSACTWNCLRLLWQVEFVSLLLPVQCVKKLICYWGDVVSTILIVAFDRFSNFPLDASWKKDEIVRFWFTIRSWRSQRAEEAYWTVCCALNFKCLVLVKKSILHLIMCFFCRATRKRFMSLSCDIFLRAAPKMLRDKKRQWKLTCMLNG